MPANGGIRGAAPLKAIVLSLPATMKLLGDWKLVPAPAARLAAGGLARAGAGARVAGAGPHDAGPLATVHRRRGDATSEGRFAMSSSDRRQFLTRAAATGAGAVAAPAALEALMPSFAEARSGGITKGDRNILI